LSRRARGTSRRNFTPSPHCVREMARSGPRHRSGRPSPAPETLRPTCHPARRKPRIQFVAAQPRTFDHTDRRSCHIEHARTDGPNTARSSVQIPGNHKKLSLRLCLPDHRCCPIPRLTHICVHPQAPQGPDHRQRPDSKQIPFSRGSRTAPCLNPISAPPECRRQDLP